MKTNHLLFITVAISFLSCQLKKGNFSVSHPKEWSVTDTMNDQTKYLKIQAPHGSINAGDNINIGIFHTPNVGEYSDKVLDYLEKESTYFKKKGEGLIMVNKYKAKWEEHFIQLQSSADTVEQKIYFIGDSGDVYQIVVSTRANEMQRIKNEMDTVLNSFTIL